MRLNDAAIGAFLLLFAGLLAAWSQTFPAIPGQEYGASVFPTLVAAGFAGCGILLIVSGIRQGGPVLILADWMRDRHGMRNVAVTILAILFYILASPFLGFILTMLPILLVLFRMLGQGWLASAALAVIVTLLTQYLFGSLLYVPLPWGPLAPWRW